MSAESHRKQSREKSTGRVVLPQVVEDKSLIDSFTGFIQDVVPQVMNAFLIVLCATLVQGYLGHCLKLTISMLIVYIKSNFEDTNQGFLKSVLFSCTILTLCFVSYSSYLVYFPVYFINLLFLSGLRLLCTMWD